MGGRGIRDRQVNPILGIRANIGQFSLLVALNAFVGAMVGLERAVVPLLAAEEFGVKSATVALSFIIVFGLVKALSNLAAGSLSDRVGRKPLLIGGWVAALPVAPMIIWAPSWGWVIAANVLLGVNQGLAWSATVIMKIDLAGPRRRGLAMGLNEFAGYGAVAIAAFVTAQLAVAHGPRPAPFLLGIGISIIGLVLSIVFVRETSGHAAIETGRSMSPANTAPRFWTTFATCSYRNRSLGAVCQSGLVNNLNDGMAWGLLPIFLAGQGLSVARIGIVAALYPATWTVGQIATGAWSDKVGRKPLVIGGLWVQAAAIASFVMAGDYAGWAASAVAMGVGTALVYPVLLAAVGDAADPSWRASAVGVYRFWRDIGYAVGALLSGVIADRYGIPTAIWTVAAISAASGVVVLLAMRETLPAATVTRN